MGFIYGQDIETRQVKTIAHRKQAQLRYFNMGVYPSQNRIGLIVTDFLSRRYISTLLILSSAGTLGVFRLLGKYMAASGGMFAYVLPYLCLFCLWLNIAGFSWALVASFVQMPNKEHCRCGVRNIELQSSIRDQTLYNLDDNESSKAYRTFHPHGRCTMFVKSSGIGLRNADLQNDTHKRVMRTITSVKFPTVPWQNWHKHRQSVITSGKQYIQATHKEHWRELRKTSFVLRQSLPAFVLAERSRLCCYEKARQSQVNIV